ncbi:hypothetical protein SELMODRAFT_268972 [Selaginella moellendorffii]|uniref:Ubiquitin-like domain-containing protein n=1 Tax=Selaginella moellendorffii TaxID=88036 RepID=D8SPJ8_SELML|nr:ubiquitin domain-containing protein DSK2a [Selaginella moellendorffii]EFJ13793.1 hypothetical protein SELMODRAFT_268972 [Selaginella moellendorffii]|eukprot:XP_002985299.1 ubiquitin domain-containing protein DSK2a [Selaginella moellendorffii]
MSAEEASTTAAPSAAATVHIRCSNGTKFSVTVDLKSTVRGLKSLLVERSEVPADQQRLIYKGRVLKDENSLDSYDLQNDHTVHLVRGAPPPGSAPAAPSPASPSPAAAPPAAAPPGGIGANMHGGFFGGAAAPLGTATTLPEFQQVQQQLMQNPNLMREMMNMPAIQSLMSNPELMRTLIMNNPQMREIIDRNPDLAHILNDPATLRQTLDAARNPELMREMMRNTDRAMSNIEASPEGFNMLRRMYETVQEPLLNAATMGGTGAEGADAQANPFAALMGRAPAATTAPAAGTGDPNQTPAAGTGATVLPNTAPLPNPWNPAARETTTTPGQQLSTLPPLGFLGGMGDGNAGGLGALGGLGGLGGIEQMLQNPGMLQAMQSVLSNPQYVQQVLNMHPQLRNILNANPQFREMMQNPEFLQQMTSPESLQQMLALQQSLLGHLGRQQPGQDQGLGQGGLGGAAGNVDLNSLLGMFGGLGSNFGATPEVNALPPEELYATQLSQLQDMGFYDTQENIRALSATNGNVHAAVERLLGNP